VLGLIAFALTSAAFFIGYIQARDFTQERLRYVSGVQRLRFPILAGLAAACVATPITWLLPLVGGGTALLFGLSVGMGAAAGARDIKRRLGA
jgi:hypothetical protein